MCGLAAFKEEDFEGAKQKFEEVMGGKGTGRPRVRHSALLRGGAVRPHRGTWPRSWSRVGAPRAQRGVGGWRTPRWARFLKDTA